jgi:hypothetical protein
MGTSGFGNQLETQRTCTAQYCGYRVALALQEGGGPYCPRVLPHGKRDITDSDNHPDAQGICKEQLSGCLLALRREVAQVARRHGIAKVVDLLGRAMMYAKPRDRCEFLCLGCLDAGICRPLHSCISGSQGTGSVELEHIWLRCNLDTAPSTSDGPVNCYVVSLGFNKDLVNGGAPALSLVYRSIAW